jgi:flavin-dependent dehydrogenase
MLTTATSERYDAVVIGGGPAGSATALMLARAGWSVAIVEKSEFPRAKVCGEFISATTSPLLAEFGLLEDVRELAGPAVRRVGLFARASASTAPMPAVPGEFGEWGQALGRDKLDLLLLQAATRAGAKLWQPYRVARLEPSGEGWRCDVGDSRRSTALSARTIIAANGSWEKNPWMPDCDAPHAKSDLLAFKAHFDDADLAPDLMPLLVFPGGYGGMVWSDHGRVSLSCCISRKVLNRCRGGEERAGDAVLRHIRQSCKGAADALGRATLHGTWHAAGPIRPGLRAAVANGIFRVGNAAGEAHPIIAEGITMAIQSAWFLCSTLIQEQDQLANPSGRAEAGRVYSARWRAHFAGRIHAAAAFAHTLMRPRSAALAVAVPQRFPALLTYCAGLSGKATRIPAASRRRA